jgi:hypothetical protein
MNIFYSDVTMNSIKGFEVSKDTVRPLKAAFKSYTEGFLASAHYRRILSRINRFRKNHGLLPLHYFHDYYEDDSIIIVSFTGGLEKIYILDKKTLKVSNLQYNDTDNLGDMYVSHIRRVNDRLILLGGEVNAYNAFIYQIDAANLSVKKAIKTATHPSAVQEEHYTIDTSGNAVFISKGTLQVLSYERGESFHIPLPFDPQYVFSNETQTIALSLDDVSMHYALYDHKLSLSHTGELALPSQNALLVDAFLRTTQLFLISYDHANNVYRNYITCYDLFTDKLIYCMGLHKYKDSALLDGSLN